MNAMFSLFWWKDISKNFESEVMCTRVKETLKVTVLSLNNLQATICKLQVISEEM